MYREYIKFYPILKKYHISQSNFSKFMTGKEEYEIFMSISNLKLIYDAIYNVCLSFTDIHEEIA